MARWRCGPVLPARTLEPCAGPLADDRGAAGVLILWELLTHVLAVPDYLLPGPTAVLARWVRDPVFFFVEGAHDWSAGSTRLVNRDVRCLLPRFHACQAASRWR